MSASRLPLVVTGDSELLDDLLRLAAAGGTQVTLAADLAAARPGYRSAPLVVIGADQAASCVRARLPRRPGVLLVGRGEVPPWIFDASPRIGAERVLSLPDAEAWLVDRFADRPAGVDGRIIAVIGGRGGAGASILSGGLAVTAVRAGHRTLLIDGDPLGGGLDLLLGWESVDGLRWSALAGAGGRVDPSTLLQALPHRGDLVLLSFARDRPAGVPSAAMAATVDAARRGRDVIVADLPRQLDDAAVMALQAADRALLIVPAELRAVAAATRVAQMIRMHRDELSVVVRGPSPSRLKPRDVAAALKMPLAGTLRPDPVMCRAVERGEPPAGDGKGPLAELCQKLITELAGDERTAVPA